MKAHSRRDYWRIWQAAKREKLRSGHRIDGQQLAAWSKFTKICAENRRSLEAS